ncbi:MAG: L-ribulokinase [Fimbriimonadaceae bacterium]|jgi:L-ribulokinase|nr:L-ribulokinase [Fimbriimonadaceae bacterium]
MAQYALGLDFGTNSVRALIVDCADGSELATGVAQYSSGDEGVITDPKDHNLARQNPLDYHASLDLAMQEALKVARATGDFDAAHIVGIGVDTTGSTPMPTMYDGFPVAMEEEFHDNTNAMAWLWKDHTAYAEAEEITDLARKQGRPYLAKCGGTYSSEWFWSKILRAARLEPILVEGPTDTWMELCDFIPGYLCLEEAGQVPRSVCAAGHKAMYSGEWGGLPDKDFLAALHPALAGLRDRLYEKAYPSDRKAGGLAQAHAEKWGLRTGTPVAVGILDAHAGAVGSGVGPGRLVKIIGTSTCDIMVASHVPDIPGVAGIVDGSVIPGMIGIEAGQSAVGDIFAWWSKVCGKSQEELAWDASRLRAGESGLIALDWNNGNRNVLADPLLSGLLVGQTLHTTAAEIYRALIEATAFGALKIIQRIEEHGVTIEDVVACGGIAEKSSMAMQIYADVLNRPIRLSRCAQAPALGAAIFGSVVGSVHADVQTAQAAMTGFKDVQYLPDPIAVTVYARLFELYEDLHDAFGLSDRFQVMKDLIAVQKEARNG